MKISLFTKKDKPLVEKVISHLKDRCKELSVYRGSIDDKDFPTEAWNEEPDLIISYLSPWIIPWKFLIKAKYGGINFHPGPSEYPGIGCFNFAIYNQEKNYGVVAHLMEERVDRGKIIALRRFPLLESYSVEDLSLKSYKELFLLFSEVIESILKKEALPDCREVWKRKPYTRRDLEELFRIDFKMSKDETAKRIKADTFPNMPGAYIDISGYRFEQKSIEDIIIRKKVALIGFGGNFFDITEELEDREYEIVGYINNREINAVSLPYLGDDNVCLSDDVSKIITVGGIGKRIRLRKKLYKIHKDKIINLFFNGSMISELVNCKENSGIIVFKNVVIKANCVLGENVFINSGCVIGHRVNIGNHSHISLGALIGGDVVIGENCFLGMGAKIFECVKIGDNCIIGADSLITKSIPDNSFVVGRNRILKNINL